MAARAAEEGGGEAGSDGALSRVAGNSQLSNRYPLTPKSVKDEVEMAEHFKEAFKHRYCRKQMPAFKPDSLGNVLMEAKDCPVRERKPLAVYLHHDDSSLASTFCMEGLCSDEVATYLNAHFVVWGCDLTSARSRQRIRTPMSGYLGFTIAEKVEQLRGDQLPLLMTITYTRWGLEVISYIRGTSNLSDFMNCLIATKHLHDVNFALELQKQEEKECTDHVWAIPWKPAQDKALGDMKEEKYKVSVLQQKQQEEEQEALKKKVAQAVSEGNLCQLRAVRVRDLTVCVMTPYHENLTMCMVALAAWHGHTHLLKPLLDAGLSVEGSGTTNWTPLMLAARQGKESVVQELISLRADPHAKDSEGATALHHAAFCGQMACVEVLARHTPATITDNNGRTPVHAASLRGHWGVIDHLQGGDWQVSAADKYGSTALHMSAWYGCSDTVKYLLEAKLNPCKKDDKGLMPLDYAVREGHHNVERMLMKEQGGRPVDLQHTRQLIESEEERGKNGFENFKKYLEFKNVGALAELPTINDPHMTDEKGMNILHWALGENRASASCITQLLEIVHPHVMTYDGFTPLDLARDKFARADKCTIYYGLYEEAVRVLESHECPKEEGSPEELYKKLLTVISTGDNVKDVSRLLCAGAPLELVGDFPNSALQLAITTDRCKIVSLLLASGASLTPCTQGLNLLQQAWYSPNTTARVYCAITKAFSRQLKRERDRLPNRPKGLREDLAKLINTVDGETPWEACWQKQSSGEEELEEKLEAKKSYNGGVPRQACWQKGSTEKRRVKERTGMKLTSFMVAAAYANCPLTASFLQWAGAWPYFSVQSRSSSITPLHAALQAGHLSLVETMVRDLGASLYIPGYKHCYPKDAVAQVKLKKVHQEVYKREQRHLKAQKEHMKDECEKQRVQMVLDLQEELFRRYSSCTTTSHPAAEALDESDQEAGAYALLVACRSGLKQLLHLLLTIAHLDVDLVVDVTSGTTALHEAAAHGKSGCVAQLLHALEEAAGDNEHNVTEAKAYSATGSFALHRLNRYSPLQPDRYGHTALHLAAMFGHKHTFELLLNSVKEDPACRAGTTAQQIRNNFTGYLGRYLRYNDKTRKEITPLDHQNADTVLKKLLRSVDFDKLPQDAKRANVDMRSGEARLVKEAVLRAVGIILGQVAIANHTYLGRPRLVGSAHDGSKLFAPDEFDINIVIPAAERVSISVHEEVDKSLAYKGNALKITVETNDPHLQGNRLMGELFGAVTKALTEAVLDDERLSVVPPSLTRTQVGVALALAWQGAEYPLLLVGVDLVPVLELPWHEAIIKPDVLTPPDTSVMHISNTADGSWRCSFALLEAEVLRQLSPEERRIQLSCKMLLNFLKAERWMPREIKSFCTWWTGRSFNVPVPAGFCLKSAFFKLLVHKRVTVTQWPEEDMVLWVAHVFMSMCLLEEKSENISPRKVFAYFGGDCEGPKIGYGAPAITYHLMKLQMRRVNQFLTVRSLMQYLRCLISFHNLGRKSVQ